MSAVINIEGYRRNATPVTLEGRRLGAMKEIIEFIREANVQELELVVRLIKACAVKERAAP